MNKKFLKDARRRLRRLLSFESERSLDGPWIESYRSTDVVSDITDSVPSPSCKALDSRMTQSYTAGVSL